LLLIDFIKQCSAGFLLFALSALACTFFEIAWAVEKQSWLSRVRAAVFWIISIVAVTATLLLVQGFIRYAGVSPLVSLDLRSTLDSQNGFILAIMYVLLPLAPLLLFDCFYYWFHRIQHSVPFLWRFHAVHHSIEELNATNCYHHASESLFRIPFILLPLTLVIEMKVPDVFIIAAVPAVWSQFVHTNTRISLGPLGYLFAGPRWHRVHHSLATEHRDKNFASFFPVLDMLFGTAYFPKSGETIKTGLPDQLEPRTIAEYLFALKRRERLLEQPRATRDPRLQLPVVSVDESG
jgi:sterol desaturase/sphingolipid hydroxylase (fatty acid hydroxylase superfamily)